MKKIIFSIFTILLIAGCTPPKEEIDIAKEEEAIKALIEESTQAYYDRNIELLTATQVTDESFIRLQGYKDSYNYSVGWEERIASLKEVIMNNPDPTAVKLINSNYKIKVYPRSAWAVYDQNIYDNEENLINMSIQARFLEKVDEEWKIVYLSSIGVTSYENDDDEEDEDVDVDYVESQEYIQLGSVSGVAISDEGKILCVVKLDNGNEVKAITLSDSGMVSMTGGQRVEVEPPAKDSKYWRILRVLEVADETQNP